jgi:hypothetical protein
MKPSISGFIASVLILWDIFSEPIPRGIAAGKGRDIRRVFPIECQSRIGLLALMNAKSLGIGKPILSLDREARLSK